MHLELTESPDDLPGLARVRLAAFSHDDLNKAMYPLDTPAAMKQWYMEREAAERTCKFSRKVAIVDSDTKEIIAYAKWHFPGEHNTAGACSGNPSSVPPPDGTNVGLLARFRREMETMQQKHYRRDTDITLTTLVTHPDHRGRGSASMLLRWGIERADALRARIYVDATDVSVHLYEKYGWKVVDEIEIDLDASSEITSTYILKGMVREYLK